MSQYIVALVSDDVDTINGFVMAIFRPQDEAVEYLSHDRVAPDDGADA
jgi:hypothetical protein